jgi:two-component system phosphoglycerate transport system response regulator PgtA
MSAKRAILIIDDSELVLEHYRMLFQDAGFEVKTVLQEDLSLQTLLETDADLVLLDVMMPDLHGDLLLKLINAMSQREVPTPVYLFSGLDDVELWQRAKSSGAAGFISKGWSEAKVIGKVREALDSREEED